MKPQTGKEQRKPVRSKLASQRVRDCRVLGPKGNLAQVQGTLRKKDQKKRWSQRQWVTTSVGASSGHSRADAHSNSEAVTASTRPEQA